MDLQYELVKMWFVSVGLNRMCICSNTKCVIECHYVTFRTFGLKLYICKKNKEKKNCFFCICICIYICVCVWVCLLTYPLCSVPCVLCVKCCCFSLFTLFWFLILCLIGILCTCCIVDDYFSVSSNLEFSFWFEFTAHATHCCKYDNSIEIKLNSMCHLFTMSCPNCKVEMLILTNPKIPRIHMLAMKSLYTKRSEVK